MGFYAREIETASRAAIAAHQFSRLRRLLQDAYTNNPFYRGKYRAAGVGSLEDLLAAVRSADAFGHLPTTTKQELLDDQAAHPPYGTNLAGPAAAFVRQHQTSGTTGTPLKVWETRQSWDWLTSLWLYQLHALDITSLDTMFMAFNFGRGLGLWNVLDAGMRVGALTLTGGGLDSLQRVESVVDNRATVLICTPSYALRLAEVAAHNGIDIRDSAVRAIIAAGEPGASIPAVRERIEGLWGASLYDSPGATEVGHIGLACPAYGVHVIESEFYVEMLDPSSLQPVAPGELGEIVVTNFGRPATPVIRYRTRDVARPAYETCGCGRTMMRLDGGIVGRSDDMFVVRGVNVFPSAIEAIIREHAEVCEYAVEIFQEHEMCAMKVRLEVDPAWAGDVAALLGRIKDRFHRRLYLRTEAEIVPPNTLPRFEGKAQRVVWR